MKPHKNMFCCKNAFITRSFILWATFVQQYSLTGISAFTQVMQWSDIVIIVLPLLVSFICTLSTLVTTSPVLLTASKWILN